MTYFCNEIPPRLKPNMYRVVILMSAGNGVLTIFENKCTIIFKTTINHLVAK